MGRHGQEVCCLTREKAFHILTVNKQKTEQYDYNRKTDQKILITDFSEEDILSDDCDQEIVKVFNNRKTISKGGPEL
jgi:hypothetical protein